MRMRETGVKCAVCKTGQVVIEIGYVLIPGSTPIIGPGSRDQHRPEIGSIHCSNPDCQILYHKVPSKPEMASEILLEFQKSSRGAFLD